MTKKNLSIVYGLLLLIILGMYTSCDEKPQEEQIMPPYQFLIGSYTDGLDQGIGLLTFDPDKSIFEAKIIRDRVSNPSFVITNRAQTLVFAVEETSGESGGKIKVFSWDRQTNTMEILDEQPTYGDHSCYIALDGKEEFLVVGNYSGGNFSTYSITAGKLTHVQTVQHEGQSIVTSRQEKAHVHATVFHPNNKQLLVADLGTDKIHLYDFHKDFAVPFNLGNTPYFEVEAGAGPRHLVVSENGLHLYLIHELTAEIGVYSYKEGQISHDQTIPLTNPTYIGNIGAAEIRISEDGRFLYASNRGDANTISTFKIDKNGRLEHVQTLSSGGLMPRNFALSKDGKFVFVANQASNNITVFERNQNNGQLKQLPLEVRFNKPVYLFGLD